MLWQRLRHDRLWESVAPLAPATERSFSATTPDTGEHRYAPPPEPPIEHTTRMSNLPNDIERGLSSLKAYLLTKQPDLLIDYILQAARICVRVCAHLT